MEIFDTLRNTKTELEFSDKVRIYLCCVTVYDDAHIGHARTIIVFDVFDFELLIVFYLCVHCGI